MNPDGPYRRGRETVIQEGAAIAYVGMNPGGAGVAANRMESDGAMPVSKHKTLDRLPPVLLVVVAALVRFALCARYLSGDETRILKNAVNFFTQHTLLPVHYRYPTLFSYLSAIPIRAGAFLLTVRGMIPSFPHLYDLHMNDSILPILPARLTSAALGVMTVVILLKIGEKFYDRNTGLFAAAILALSNIHAYYSGYAFPDATMTLFAACSIFFALSALHDGSLRNYILAGACAGLAAATKYNGALIMLVILCVHIVRVDHPRRLLSIRYHGPAALSVLFFACAFVAGSPGWLLNPKPFWLGLMYERGHMATGDPWDAGIPYIRQAWSAWHWEKTTAVLFALGLIYALYRRRKTDVVLLIACVACFVYIGGLGKKDIHYMLFLFPALALLSGRMLSEAHAALKRTAAPSIGILLIFCALAWPAYTALSQAGRQVLPDNRTIAGEWIQNNIEEGAKIVVDWAYIPKLYISSTEFITGRRNAENAAPGRAPKKLRLYMHVPFLHGTEYLLNVDAKYLMTSSGCYERYIDPPPPPRTPSTTDYYKLRDTYSALLFDAGAYGWRLRKRFDGGKGPEILIFERTNDADSPGSMK